MLRLERLLQTLTAAMVALGAILLGVGQENAILPALAIAAAVGSLVLTDSLALVRLPRSVANVAAVASVAYALRNFLDSGTQLQLLAIANMLVYLQVVLLFQEKTRRIYWQLTVLSLLEVVVAAAMNVGLVFGLLLAGFVGVAIWALVLVYLLDELRHWPEPAPRGPARPAAVLLPAVELAARVAPLPLATVAHQAILLTAATCLFAFVFFYATPRYANNAAAGVRTNDNPVSGIDQEVTLEQSGRIEQSDQLALRAFFSRSADRQPYHVQDEFYLHGMALTRYVVENGESRWLPPVLQRNRWSRGTLPSGNSLEIVRQDIVLLSPADQSLFCVLPYRPQADTPREVRFLRQLHRLIRASNYELTATREYRYSAGTSAFRGGLQLRAVPHFSNSASFDELIHLERERLENLDFPAERFPGLTALAEEVLLDRQLAGASTLHKALALQNHLRAPGNFRYTVDLNFERRRELDPIEDFVVNHRAGHCEYFASALVMMLRSQGIPARMAVGYKGGEFNSLGGYYAVRQRHAHAWVEAWIPANEVPRSEWADDPSAAGAWFRLDPTPPADLAGSVTEVGWFDRVGEFMDYADLLWRDYVLGLDKQRQRSAGYDPLAMEGDVSDELWSFFKPVAPRAARRWLAARPQLASASWAAGGLALALAGAGLALAAALWRKRKRQSAGGGPGTEIDFYRRLEKLLTRRGLPRRPAETAREWALAAAQRLAAAPAWREAADVPAQVVEAYYRVRFGGAALDKAEREAIEQSLLQLAVVLMRPCAVG